MKNRTNIIFFVAFLASLLLYVHILHNAESAFLIYSFHAVPVFCLQLLLCRIKPWIGGFFVSLPVALMLELGIIGLLSADHWVEQLIFGAMMVGSIAPVIGCSFAWAVYGLQLLYKRGDIRR